ncbi:class I SAM-dependent methyltransferase [Mycobacterium simiae]|uniref:Class I SAM-dependent methyltransferase n=1 Tax=Mycobacterium simiae TaxID=1784 RepID=A0A5B1BU01_MYCSI|nr:class I SAM-dependent methyltransferase [Mycobacterium simiae]KAA1251816.1 class I SAM-dependent methyltransferase [Mycobacterium simiae]
MPHEQSDLCALQRQHWQDTYRAHPDIYGSAPSAPAVYAANLFKAAGAKRILELAAGHGRDALFFARQGFTVLAIDFSDVAIERIRRVAETQSLAGQLLTIVHDLREPVPLESEAVDAVFAHMALCMALSTKEIHALVSEVRRVIRPGGTFVYTVRHTGDAHHGAGNAHGDDVFEHGGFVVHFFSRQLVDALTEGWTLNDVHAFAEGALPRRLWRVTMTKPR